MKIDISHVAKLANLQISKEEESKFESQLSLVLDYISRLAEINTDNIEETSQTTGLENVMRDDIPTPSLPQGDALSQDSNAHNGFFTVKGVFDDD